ncbi:Cupredoxin [Gymnopilus junonius]|uniref:laccase n=1 Tax=Gymnopilus junonius TaxID=109634 RepID=A0A9P5TI22_GYMJU|nr:Cupredoxin [Gymnopilus junonius]
MLSTSFVLLSLLAGCLGAIGPNADLYIRNNYIQPDGYNRSAVLAAVNETTGLLPGPLISGIKCGDTFNLNVVNELSDTTMHWHGFFQHGSNWADGPVGVNQCPIIPGDSFLYQFSVPDQAGTFWYHSHHSTQYCDGLRGPFVVYDPDDPYLSQYHETAPSLAGTTIIEVDSVNVEPLVVDSIQIFAGQRYSFILETNQTVSNYWVRAMPNAGSVTFDGGINSAILRYFGADQVDPTTTQALSNPMVETNLHPLTNAAAPGNSTSADVSLNFAIDFNFAAFQFNINGATFIPPSVPVLLQILSGAQTAQDLLPSGSVYVIPPNAVIEISIPGGSVGNPHPFHLHGHTFSVVRSAGSSVYNYDNPVQRDVVSTGVAGDNVTIRFETNNVGPWIMHCHIDWHLSEGLAVVFAEDVPDVNNSSIPTAWDDLCPTYNAYPTQSFT